MIGERLRKARLDIGLTQKALAIELKISAAAISQYESGKKFPRLNVFLRMVDILHVSPEYILGRDISVASNDTDYIVRLSKEDLNIINEIKKYTNLYHKLSVDTKNVILAWNKRISLK